VNIEDLASLKEHVSTIDGQRPERLDEVRDRIHTARRRRAATAIGGAAAALAVTIALIAHPTSHTTPEPAGIPGEVLAPDPFLSNHQASVWVPRIRLTNTTPPRLDHCLPDPRTWGAVKTQAATYHDPHSGHAFRNTRMNEYLMQYADASSAHRALLDEFRQAKVCAHGDFAPIQRPGGGGWVRDPTASDGVRVVRYDEGFAAQWGDSATRRYSVLRVARADNVLVVIEDATMYDHYYYWLSQAVHQALPHYRWHAARRPTASETPDAPAT
jgi:hypothetical protein